MRRLPSSMALLAFEAAARSLSFAKAAEELALTPGAVSRQIKGLEDFLGTALFRRHHKRVELSPAGQQYLAEIRPALQALDAATGRLRPQAGEAALSLAAYPTFAIRWFIPRWGRFYDRHPEIDLRLTTTLAPVDPLRDGYDMAILVRPEGAAEAGLEADTLLDVELFPVCSPSVAARLATPADLAQVTLLHGAPRPDDWPRWLASAGIDGIDGRRGLNFESLNLVLQSAIEGLGVAIAVGDLVGDDLAAGRLVRPFKFARRSAHPFRLLCPTARARDPRLRALRDWLLEEAGRKAG